MAAQLAGRDRQSDGKPGKGRHHGRTEPDRSTESRQERQGRRRKLSRPPLGGEPRELTTSCLSERKADAHDQWRRLPTGADDWREGLGGSKAPSQWREEEQALRAAPLGARPENAVTMNDYRPGLQAWAAFERCPVLQLRKSKAPGAGPSFSWGRASGNCSSTKAAERLAPRTNSGGGGQRPPTIGRGSGGGEASSSGERRAPGALRTIACPGTSGTVEEGAGHAMCPLPDDCEGSSGHAMCPGSTVPLVPLRNGRFRLFRAFPCFSRKRADSGGPSLPL